MPNLSDGLVDVEFKSLGSRDATVAHVEFGIPLVDLMFSASGTSKRDPQDEDDPEVAFLLAYGRAFETLGKKMQKRANSLTKHADDIRTYKEKQLENMLTPGTKVKKLPAKSAARKAKVAAKK